MRTRRSILAAVLLVLAAAGFAAEARAEISVETDYAGDYVRTQLVTSATVRGLRIWSVERTRSSANALNPTGDQNGDLWPTILENPFDSNRPWVVWSRYRNVGYDLVWSRWRSTGWTEPTAVEPRTGDDGGDDLDARMAFGSGGQLYLTWWRDEGGTGRVYFSFFADGEWTREVPISDAGIDSRYPRIAALPDGSIPIQFDTPGGVVIRFVYVPVTDSIQDDIDPITPKGYVPPVTSK